MQRHRDSSETCKGTEAVPRCGLGSSNLNCMSVETLDTPLRGHRVSEFSTIQWEELVAGETSPGHHFGGSPEAVSQRGLQDLVLAQQTRGLTGLEHILLKPRPPSGKGVGLRVFACNPQPRKIARSCTPDRPTSDTLSQHPARSSLPPKKNPREIRKR